MSNYVTKVVKRSGTSETAYNIQDTRLPDEVVSSDIGKPLVVADADGNFEVGDISPDTMHAVTYVAQTLTPAQQSQARQNIGVDGAVVYDNAQTLTDEQKTQARENIGSSDVVVSIDGDSVEFAGTSSSITDEKDYIMKVEAGNKAVRVGGPYPVYSVAPTSTSEWNAEYRFVLSAPSGEYTRVTIPTPQLSSGGVTGELRMVITINSASANMPGFVPPTGMQFMDSDELYPVGTAVVYTWNQGSVYEVSMEVLGNNKIAIVSKEWPNS